MSLAPRWLILLLGPAGLTLALFWGFAEGTLFFIVPDLIITLTALYAGRKALLQMGAVTLGSLLAGTLLYLWAMQDPAAALELILSIPFVMPGMLKTVQADYLDLGAWALCKGPMSGIPYKLYAVTAPQHLGPALFLLVSIPARLERLVTSWLVFAVIGRLFKAKLQRRPAIGLGFHACYWALIYAFYWSNL